MDFLDPAKKRAHRRRLFIGYILVAVAIAIGTLILFFKSYGYDFDRQNGGVIQNGLVFITSRPGGADIYLNGNLHRSQTDARLVLPAGQYTVELKRAGYRTWQRSFTLEGGSIERFVYPLLIPDALNSYDVQLYASQPSFASQSLDRRWLIVQQPTNLAAFDLFDLNEANGSPTAFSLPADILTAVAGDHALETVEWADNNRHLLIEHRYQGGNEYILIDREQPASSLNLTKRFNKPGGKFSLRDKKSDQYFIFEPTAGLLQTADLRRLTVTPFLSRVLAFKSHGDDTVLYATDDNAPAGKVSVKLRDNSGVYNLRNFPTGTAYMLEIARFDGRWFVVVGAASEGKTYVYRDPLQIIKRPESTTPLVPVTILKLENPQRVIFSHNTRFIAAVSGQKLAVYDAETDRSYKYDIKLPIDAAARINWTDGHRLSAVSHGNAVIFDYDGSNLQLLTATNLPFHAFFAPDYETVFTIAPSRTVPNRSALVGASLLVQ